MVSAADTSESSHAAHRGAEVIVGLLAGVFALGLTAFACLGFYRVVEQVLELRSFPSIGFHLFNLVLLAAALGLWLITFRLLRGRGRKETNSLLSRGGWILTATFLVLWSLLAGWAALEIRAWWPLLGAAFGLPLAVASVRLGLQRAGSRRSEPATRRTRTP